MPQPVPRLLLSDTPKPTRPLMVYDGDCGFCRLWIKRWGFLSGNQVEYRPYQEAASQYPEISLDQFKASVQLIEPDGKVTSGALAVFKSLSFRKGLGWISKTYEGVPLLAGISESAYQFVANHRRWFSMAGSCGTAPADEKPRYRISRWLFIKMLALGFLAAFLSLGSQVDGLIGSSGLLPVSNFLNEVHRQAGAVGFYEVPTLCWLSDSDGFLHFLCGAGAVLSVFLLLDIAPALCLFLLWLFYLSLVKAGQDFMSFQWDSLLLEAGFLALLASPLAIKPGSTAKADPPALLLFLFQWLLFRLIFCAGVVKLSSGDPSWQNLTALCFHYHTQPLPTLLSWYFDGLPVWFQKFSCLFMFFTELGVPFALWGPRKLKPYAFGFWLALQILIALTGNYCFFNWLAAGLGLFFLEDAAWPGVVRRIFYPVGAKETPPGAGTWHKWIQRAYLVLVLILSSMQMTFSFKVPMAWPAPLALLYDAAGPFETVNSYGLFAIMTTNRDEIVLEGSEDGKLWKPYGFKNKPGDLQKAPSWSAPHQPRLDWQMWFAALGDYRDNPWFLSLEAALLRGNEEVLNLLGSNPFPDRPPRFLRARFYEYRFTTRQEKAATGAWWSREEKGFYGPTLSLRE